MLLEPIFEADFRNCSHGFRQGRSTFTALRNIARTYPATSWIIEGDIQGCFDNTPHGQLMQAVSRRIADGKILHLIRKFLKAGYMEDWKHHRTYSGTAQGGVVSPLLANVFLHQLDEFVENELKGNQKQSKKQANARRNPQHQRITGRINTLRKELAKAKIDERQELAEKIRRLQQEQKKTAYYDKTKKHPCALKHERYADDWLNLVNGTKEKAVEIRQTIGQQLAALGLTLSAEKTKLTHWAKPVRFLGYRIKGILRPNNVGIRAVLEIPQEAYQRVAETITRTTAYIHIPEADLIAQLNAIFRGWCNYYRYADSPQTVFGKLTMLTWWKYAHYLARKRRASIKQVITQERKAGRLAYIEKDGRRRLTFMTKIKDKTLILDLFPPKTAHIKGYSNPRNWNIDLKPLTISNWQNGRSLATRLTALTRANGVCERCREHPATHVHHTSPIGNRPYHARVMSDASQRYTAMALCKACHLEAHGGSWNRRSSKTGTLDALKGARPVWGALGGNVSQ